MRTDGGALVVLDGIRSAGCEVLDTLREVPEGVLVAARSADRGEVLLFVPRTPEDGARERERLEALRGPGIPGARPVTGESFEAIVLVGAEGARPLASAPAFPDAVWRPGLVRLLSALSQAHGRGWAHGRIARGHVLADPSGGFWIWGWAGGSAIRERGPFPTGFDEIGLDLRDLGIALSRHLAGTDDEAGDEATPATIGRAHARVALFDPELARVLARLVTLDPRESYRSATEVLTDLGEADESLPDPWARLPFVGRRRVLRRILAHAERAGTGPAAAARFDVVGGPGSGRTRLLDETARAARDRGFVVIHAAGGAEDGPWGALGSIGRQLLARLPASHPLRADPGVLDLAREGRPGGARDEPDDAGDGATAALAALLDAGFRGARGLVLLDDADTLQRRARAVWLGLARHVAAAADGRDAPAVLLVGAGASAPPSDPAVPSESAELDDLGRRHVAHLLSEILTERGRAPALAAEIASVAGGRPADLVEHLRELVARGVLVPVGRRFSVEAAPAGAVARATDAFRRAAESAGREGRAVAEALAVARGLRLSRDAVSSLADVPAHRLNQAAESAIRAGLLVRDGSAWRVRTETVRIRLESALPEERRRTLHREILSGLLEAREPDWPAIAHHARASGEPHAAEWTRRALAVLRGAGRYDEAATHFEDACSLLGPGAFDVAMRLEQADTLLCAGRLDDALRVAESVRADPAATPRQHGEAALAVAWLHRYDQAWSKVLAVDLPVDCGDPMILARMRLVRAAAYTLSGRIPQAERERRLALSELPDPSQGGAELAYWLDEVDAQIAIELGQPEQSRRAFLRRLRSPVARTRMLQVALDLVRYANTQRLLLNNGLARSVLARARQLAARHLGGNPLVETWALSTLALVSSSDGDGARRERFAEAAAFAAGRTGASTLALNKSLTVVSARCGSKAVSSRHYSRLRSLSEHPERLFPDVVTMSPGQLVGALVECGLHQSLERMELHASGVATAPAVRAWLAFGCRLSGILLSSPPGDIPGLQLASDSDAVALEAWARLQFQTVRHAAAPFSDTPNMLMSSLALALRRGRFRGPGWPDRWSVDALLRLVDSAGPRSSWGAVLAASLAVCARSRLTEEELSAVRERVAEMPPQFPAPLEWLRHLAAARECYAEGRVSTALRHMTLARRSALALDRPESGSCRAAAYRAAVECIEAYGVLVRPAAAPRPAPLPAGAAVPAWPAWDPALRTVASSRAVLVTSADVRELEEFASVVAASLPAFDLGAGPAAGSGPLATGIVRPSAAADPASVRTAAERHAAAGGRVVVLLGAGRAGDRAAERVRAAWLRICGVVVELPAALGSPEGRSAAFAEAVRRRLGGRAPVETSAAEAVAEYPWPGGIAEIDAVVSEIAALAPDRVDAATLDRIGWRRRLEWTQGRELHPQEQAVLRVLGRSPWASSSRVARGVGCPARTTVRLLTRLVEAGRVVRRGVGRATRYATTATATEGEPTGAPVRPS